MKLGLGVVDTSWLTNGSPRDAIFGQTLMGSNLAAVVLSFASIMILSDINCLVLWQMKQYKYLIISGTASVLIFLCI